MGKNTDELQLMQDEIKKLSPDVPTREVWKALVYLMLSFKEKLDATQEIVRGDGNGEKGLLHRVANLETRLQNIDDRTKVTQSDTRETLNILRQHLLDNKKEQSIFSEKKEKVTEKWWFLLGMALLAGVVSPVLLWLATDIFPRIFSIPHP